MKIVSCVLAMLFVTCAPTYAQTVVTGKWRAEQPGIPFPWEVDLRADGTGLAGTVSSCDSVQLTIEVLDGKVGGNTVTFKCHSGDGRRTISFTGRINGDKIAFTWDMHVASGDRNTSGLFASSAPNRFTARRVRAGDRPKVADNMGGTDFVAAINLLRSDIRATGTLFVPAGVRRVRAVLVVINYGLGGAILNLPEWSRLAETLGAGLLGAQFTRIGRGDPGGLGATNDASRSDALLELLQRLAQDSQHQELTEAPLLFWGHSLGASAAAAFAACFPDRTLAFVRYHGTSALGADFRAVSGIPALFLSGGKEENPLNAPGSEALWKRGRAMGAPWAFAVDPDANHGDEQDYRYLKKAEELMIPWITAIVRQRLSPDEATLRVVSDQSAWFGNNQTGDVTSSDAVHGSRAEASWLPDEPSARGWRIVTGAVK